MIGWFVVQIEVQATTRPALPKEDSHEADHTETAAQSDTRAITDGSQAASDVHDVSPSSPPGNGTQQDNSKTKTSTKSKNASGQPSDSSQSSSNQDSGKSGSKSSAARPSEGKSSGSKQSNSGQTSTIGGRGTQEEYQEARLRFLSSGQGVLVSADSVSLDEGQVGSLVTASFDDL